jgi:pyruvate dehydrogenase E2 component (dihydrolipoamide acetyltransferase)
MPIQIIVPTLGEAVSEATLVDWSKNEGESVRRGDEIAELETEKANLSLECPANGILLSILVHPGDVVKPGQVLALVGEPGEGVSASPPWEQPGELSPPSTPAQTDEGGEAAYERAERVSPAARRLARKLGIDLFKVTPSKPGARITSEDVDRFAVQGSGSGGRPALPFHRVELSRIQKAVAARMMESASQIPQFSVSMDADATRLIEVKHELASQNIQASFSALLIYLTARALRDHPLLNARFERDSVLVYEAVNMAVAVATEGGLLAPVLHGVEKLSLPDIIQQLAELLPAARENRLSLEQVSGATFTLSNLGTHGVRQFVPLVYPPQSAILGVGAAHQVVSFAGSKARAADVRRIGGTATFARWESTAYDDSAPANIDYFDRRTSPTQDQGIEVRWIMTLTVSADHRVLDGEAAALFLASLCKKIENSNFKE